MPNFTFCWKTQAFGSSSGPGSQLPIGRIPLGLQQFYWRSIVANGYFTQFRGRSSRATYHCTAVAWKSWDKASKGSVKKQAYLMLCLWLLGSNYKCSLGTVRLHSPMAISRKFKGPCFTRNLHNNKSRTNDAQWANEFSPRLLAYVGWEERLRFLESREGIHPWG